MGVKELLQRASALIDAGVLTKHDESFVTTTVGRFEKGHRLDGSDISRLRVIVDDNS